MARSTSIALLVVVAFAAAASVGSAQPLRAQLFRTDGSGNQRPWYLPPPLPQTEGGVIGALFADVYRGISGRDGTPTAVYKYSPSIGITPKLQLTPVNVAPALNLAVTPLDLSLGEAVAGGLSVKPSLTVNGAASTSASASAPAVTPPSVEVTTTGGAPTTTTTVQGA